MTPAEAAGALAAHPRWEWWTGMTMIPAGFDRERWLLCWCDRRYDQRPDGTWPDGPTGWNGGAYQTSGSKWWGIASSETPIDLGDGWVPDLTDDATAGVLLGMLRSAVGFELGLHYSIAARADRRWYVNVPREPEHYDTHYGATLGEAAGRALLAVLGPA